MTWTAFAIVAMFSNSSLHVCVPQSWANRSHPERLFSFQAKETVGVIPLYFRESLKVSVLQTGKALYLAPIFSAAPLVLHCLVSHTHCYS